MSLRGQVAGQANSHAPVAQLDSASVFGTEGWGFESLRAYFGLFSKRGGVTSCQGIVSNGGF